MRADMNCESGQLKEVLSWRFVTELHRRYPKRFTLIEAHPGGGTYDCLVLLTNEPHPKFGIDVNRNGSVHVHADAFTTGAQIRTWNDWAALMSGAEPARLLDEVCSAAGLDIPSKLPPTTSASLVFRTVTEFLTHTVGRLEYWECRNGYEDTSGYSGGVRTAWFDRFPAARRAAVRRSDDLFAEPAYRFWFLLEDRQPRLCLETTGKAYRLDGGVIDLMPIYRKRRRIWPIIADVALDLLP